MRRRVSESCVARRDSIECSPPHVSEQLVEVWGRISRLRAKCYGDPNFALNEKIPTLFWGGFLVVVIV